MTTHTIECEDPWFSFIEAGKKTVEGRKNTERWAKIKAGDSIIFVEKKASARTFKTKVTKVVKYPGPNALEKYLVGEGIEKALPGITTLEAAKAVYQQWSTEKEIEDAGAMLGIHVALE